MMHILHPRYEKIKELKYLTITIRCYSIDVLIYLNNKYTNEMVFSKSYKSYTEDFSEIDEFIENYNKEIDKKKFDESLKMYNHALIHFNV